ncbi:hypothetical protein DVH05_021636 [Phytophthora capsici]|nr:hypothetical protein DVH05_021636 [Phytophthora capsici]
MKMIQVGERYYRQFPTSLISKVSGDDEFDLVSGNNTYRHYYCMNSKVLGGKRERQVDQDDQDDEDDEDDQERSSKRRQTSAETAAIVRKRTITPRSSRDKEMYACPKIE